MPGKIAAVARVFGPAYAGAVTWVLAGCGWGLVVGSALEAAFGQGPDGLLDAAGELGLEATSGALLGMVGGALLLTSLHLVTLTPLFALVGKYGGRYQYGDSSLGIMHERSARMGVVTSVLCGLTNATAFGPLAGAGALLESLHGGPLPDTFLHAGTLVGILAGGIVGTVALGRSVWQSLPVALREEIRRSMRRRAWPPAPPVCDVRRPPAALR